MTDTRLFVSNIYHKQMPARLDAASQSEPPDDTDTDAGADADPDADDTMWFVCKGCGHEHTIHDRVRTDTGEDAIVCPKCMTNPFVLRSDLDKLNSVHDSTASVTAYTISPVRGPGDAGTTRVDPHNPFRKPPQDDPPTFDCSTCGDTKEIDKPGIGKRAWAYCGDCATNRLFVRTDERVS